MAAITTYCDSLGCWPSATGLSVCITSEVWCALISRPSLGRDEVDDGEDHDPDDVDEVPVQASDLHHLGLLLRELAPQRKVPEREQHHDAERDVHAMEPREHEEAGAEEVGLDREALADERGELVHLAGDERGAEERRG